MNRSNLYIFFIHNELVEQLENSKILVFKESSNLYSSINEFKNMNTELMIK